MAPARPSMRCKKWPPTRGSWNTNLTGPRARNCWPGQASMTKPAEHTKSLSVSNAILRSAASCSDVNRLYQLESSPTLWPGVDLVIDTNFLLDSRIKNVVFVDFNFV